MPTLAPERLQSLAATLIRLRGETLGRVAKATGVRTANLSVWLRGKEQVISDKRQVGLLHYFGVEGGRLRTDILHRWFDRGALEDCKMVLSVLLANTHPVWLFRDNQPGLIKTRFLLAGDALIRLEIEPGVDRAFDLEQVVNADRSITTSAPLAGVPTATLQSTWEELLALAEQAAAELGDGELLDSLMFRLSEEVPSNAFSQLGWQQLERAIHTAFKSGASPADIARFLESHYGHGRNTTIPPNSDRLPP